MPLLIRKHARQPKTADDGARYLVTRYWPRGAVSAYFDDWLRDLAPSATLLDFLWHGAGAGVNRGSTRRGVRYAIFIRRYRAELRDQISLIADLRRRYRRGETLSLVCACHDWRTCHRSILADVIRHGLKGRKRR